MNKLLTRLPVSIALVSFYLNCARATPILPNERANSEGVRIIQSHLGPQPAQMGRLEAGSFAEESLSGKTENSNGVRAARCLEPTEELLHNKFMQKDGSYKNSPIFVYPLNDSPGSSKNSVFGNIDAFPTAKVTTNLTCPLELANPLDEDISERSLCPWTFKLDSDPDRFPRVMAVAACRCQNCIDVTSHSPSLDNYCQPVTYRVRVMRRLADCDQDGYYRYKFTHEAVPVACVCLRPRVYRGPTALD